MKTSAPFLRDSSGANAKVASAQQLSPRRSWSRWAPLAALACLLPFSARVGIAQGNAAPGAATAQPQTTNSTALAGADGEPALDGPSVLERLAAARAAMERNAQAQAPRQTAAPAARGPVTGGPAATPVARGAATTAPSTPVATEPPASARNTNAAATTPPTPAPAATATAATSSEPLSESDALLARLAAQREADEKQLKPQSAPAAADTAPAPTTRGQAIAPPAVRVQNTTAATAGPASAPPADIDPILARLMAGRTADETGAPQPATAASTNVSATPASSTNTVTRAPASGSIPLATNFAIIQRRNIFDPNRQGDGIRATTAPRMDAFSLTGTMIFEGGASYAWFGGTSPQYSNDAIRKGGTIAGFNLVEIREDSVDLVLNGATNTLTLQGQMRRLPGAENPWLLAEGTAATNSTVRTLQVATRGNARGGAGQVQRGAIANPILTGAAGNQNAANRGGRGGGGPGAAPAAVGGGRGGGGGGGR